MTRRTTSAVSTRSSTDLRRLTTAAVATALVFLFTFLIKVPTVIGYIHLGDAFVLLYAALTGDKLPYSIDVIRNQNTVIVYGKDESGAYTMPVKVFVCSNGNWTPTGRYTIGSKQEWCALFGGVWGQYAQVITGNILFHSVPYTRRDKGSLESWEYNKLGTTASMGCVRLAVADVKWIYDFCPRGTPVHIFDADETPLPRPEPMYLDPDDPRSGWDPTDPDEDNPWLEVYAEQPPAKITGGLHEQT